MHTMWKGSISFGLVNIPIKLYAATEDKDIKLRSLHKECHAPIKYEKKCTSCEKTLAPDEIVKGYEYVKGKYVILTDEELKELKQEHEEKAVEIVDFVQLKEIDPIYFNRSYYVGPGDNGSKAYTLLREALRTTEKIGIATITIRSKQQLAVLRVYENCILMESIHYPDEVRSAAHVPGVPDQSNVNDKELQTAITLIDELTTDFQPEQYEDTYRKAIMQKINDKLENKETAVTPGTAAPREDVIDLVSALQASIDRTKRPNQDKAASPPAMPAAPKGAGEKKRKTTRKKASGTS
ncbi:Ku protein [Bacillus atrophaeus]|uniref:non-homologous end joining protein Ku n=1 Tax=Bacillus atrophaeus TaxID=1452 RepID=UPI000C05CCDC|nr:Ku protein [Bacillus atrophaeus]ATO29412.1 Ku protein [Bacillus atrophaeus]MBJ7895768.1 Ku protein [Bacillus atrophaeus]PSA96378.1 Ku protein [Bacillus atrophaeus]